MSTERNTYADEILELFPWPEGAEAVEVAPDLFLPSTLRVEWPLPQEGPVTEGLFVEMSARLRLELEHYRYVTRGLSVDVSGDEGVTGKLLRTLPLRELTELPVRWAARTTGEAGSLVLFDTNDYRLAANDGPTDANLKLVARIYALGFAMQVRPTGAVEDALGLKRSTAENWVRRAKDRGYVYAEA